MVGGAYAPRHRWRRSIQVARLPSHSQGYCSTHERYLEEFSSGPILVPYNGVGWFFSGIPETLRGLQAAPGALEGPPAASRGPGACRRLQTFQGPRASRPFKNLKVYVGVLGSPGRPRTSRNHLTSSRNLQGTPLNLFQLLRTFSVQMKGVVVDQDGPN